MQELLGPIHDAADALNAFNRSLHSVTDQVANIPRSFRQAALAATAEISGLGPNVPQLPEPRRLRGTDINIPVPTEFQRGEGASLPDFISVMRDAARSIKAAKQQPGTVTGNTIQITIPGFSGDIRELAREVARALKELGTADASGNKPAGLARLLGGSLSIASHVA